MQPSRVFENSPSALTVAPQGGGSQLLGQLRIAISTAAAGCRLIEGAQDAVAHLIGCLAGKGDGKDRFGFCYFRVAQQVEEALYEQLGFPGTGGGLNDK